MPTSNITDLTETLRLHNLWRQGNPTGIQADLRGANLRAANLGEADLRWADLGGADLREANLREANLREANLESATLPERMAWWQGGAYGPRRRMIRVLSVGGTITVMAGCLTGTRDDVENNLAGRVSTWADEIGQDAADQALNHALALIDIGCKQVTA